MENSNGNPDIGGVREGAVGVVKALENKLGATLVVADTPQENGAIGAAVLASRL